MLASLLTCSLAMASPDIRFSENDHRLAELLAYSNLVRREYRLDNLRFDEQLTNAAQAKAEDLARWGRLSHRDSQGRDPGRIVDQFGYRWRQVAENLASGYQAPGQAVEGWLNSPSHRANLVHPSMKDVGFGFARDGKGRAYWVMILAQKMR